MVCQQVPVQIYSDLIHYYLNMTSYLQNRILMFSQNQIFHLGWEINTATHTFQIFVANYNQIINQRNLVFNTNDFTKGDYLVGFNITVRF